MTNSTHNTSDDTVRFPSAESLRAAHSELLKRFRAQREKSDMIAPEMIAEVEAFIRRGKATGALLDTDTERWATQSQLDYWATQLYRPDYEPPDATLDEFDPQLAPELDDALCPYVGLNAFSEANRSIFFGRERVVDELVNKLKAVRFLAVLGSSGSGKSSIVRAGLIPALKAGALPGSVDWKYCPPMVPGSNPLENLARIITTSLDMNETEIQTEAERLRQEPDYLANTVSEHLKENLVIIVDQFEEIFTLCTDDVARQSFVDNLISLCQTPTAQHHVIITMRTDFETNISRLPNLQTVFEQGVMRITPFSASELREAIEAPAALIGLKFEEGVVDALLSDTLGEPAALPLLQFTLLKLWESRERNRVTWEAYKKLGGGRQALARVADEFYNQLIPEEQVTMRRILLKMVRPGEGLEVTSNRVPRIALYKKAEANDRIERVLDRLIQSRLVRISEGDTAADEQVEVAHEALVRNWPRLVMWLEEERATMRQRQRLTSAVEEWLRLKRAPSALWRGEQLIEAQRYDDLTDKETSFVRAGFTRQRRGQAALTGGVFAIIALLIVAVIIFSVQSNTNAGFAMTAQAASTVAVEQYGTARAALADAVAAQGTAQAASTEAVKQANIAFANQLASQAQSILANGSSNQMLAVLLATKSLQKFPSQEAAQILQNNSLAVPITSMAHDGAVSALAFSPNGKVVASGSYDNTVRVWDALTGKEIARMTHGGPVYALAFSPDGKVVVSGSEDYTARVWDAATGKEIARMTHNGPVYTLAFSLDGRYIVSGGCDEYNSQQICIKGSARVWEAMTGNEIARMTHDGAVYSVAFSPDGKYVISGSDDHTARVWNSMTGDEIARKTHFYSVYSVAFSPDGTRVASASCSQKNTATGECTEGRVHVWDAMTGKDIHHAPMLHASDIYKVAFSPDGKYIVSASADKTARVWDAATGQEIARMTHDSQVNSVAFSPDGNYVVSGSNDKTARLWEAMTGKEIARMTHNDSVTSAAFSPDGKVVVSGSNDTAARVWQAVAKKGIAQMTHGNTVYALAFSPDNNYVMSGSYDNTARVWETTTGKEIARMTHNSYVSSVAFSPDGKVVVSGSNDGTARLWDAMTGKEIARMTHDGPVYTLAFSPDGKYVVSGGCDEYNKICIKGSARVWDAMTGNEIARMTHDGAVYSVAFSPDGKYVISGGCGEYNGQQICSKGSARVWEALTGKEIARMNHDGTVTSVAFSPDGKYVISGSDDHTARVWEAMTGKEIARMTHDGPVYALAFSPDGKVVVSGSDDHTARVWEAMTGKEIARMTHNDYVTSVAFSPDGKLVASGSDDNTARVWDALTGKEIARMTHNGYVYSVAFSPDGKYIASNAVSTAIVWIYRPEDLIAEACLRVTRNLTLAEWQQYIGDALPYQAVCSNLPFDSKYLKAIAMNALSNADDPNRVKTALDQVQAVLIQEAGLVQDPITESISIVSEAVGSAAAQQITRSSTSRDIEKVLDLLEQAKQIQVTLNNKATLNNLCWFGSINGYAKQVLQYCESAVKLAPDSANFRDSRGLARALTGDYQGAILDFQYLVDHYGNINRVKQRKQWIEQLKKGIDPFTADVLESLKQQ
jgi:uncharacterized delta-60 repeat protein